MPHECIILADSPGALVDLCGISTLERLLRTLQRCGINRVTVLSATPEGVANELNQPSWPRAQIAVTIAKRTEGVVTAEQVIELWPKNSQHMLILRGDAVFDPRLLRALLSQNSATALVDSAPPAQLQPLIASAPDTSRGKLCGAALLDRDWIKARSGPFDEAVRRELEQGSITPLEVANLPWYHPSLRRRLRPFWFPAPLAEQKKLAEQALLDSIEKGSQDFPALVHAPIERFLISHLWKTSIRPNQITIAWAIGAFLTTILFAAGHLIWGVVFALIVGILDGLDGNQARIKIETTEGGKLEHQIDNVLDVAWPSALAYHFYASGQLPGAFFYLGLLILAEAADGIGKAGIYSSAEKSMKEPATFDRIVRLVGGRRNIFVWILVAAIVLGAPAKALIVMAWWELVTAAVDLPHAAWAVYFRRRKTPVR